MGREKIYCAQLAIQVENIKNVLKTHNIESYVTNQYLSSVSGEIPPQETWPQLWVGAEDVEPAKAIIESILKEPKESLPAVSCPKCGEEIEGQFAECWKCGTMI